MSYFTDRTQVIKVSEVTSAESLINIRVPQGPILLLIYVNDLPDIQCAARCTLFADDNTVAFKADTLVEALEVSMTAQKKFEEWFYANRLQLNSDKKIEQ